MLLFRISLNLMFSLLNQPPQTCPLFLCREVIIHLIINAFYHLDRLELLKQN